MCSSGDEGDLQTNQQTKTDLRWKGTAIGKNEWLRWAIPNLSSGEQAFPASYKRSRNSSFCISIASVWGCMWNNWIKMLGGSRTKWKRLASRKKRRKKEDCMLGWEWMEEFGPVAWWEHWKILSVLVVCVHRSSFDLNAVQMHKYNLSFFVVRDCLLHGLGLPMNYPQTKVRILSISFVTFCQASVDYVAQLVLCYLQEYGKALGMDLTEEYDALTSNASSRLLKIASSRGIVYSSKPHWDSPWVGTQPVGEQMDNELNL